MLALGQRTDTDALCEAACARRDARYGHLVTFSPKVFIPLTRLCRDVCHYCTFATTPSKLPAPFLALDEVLAIARAGREAGCHEALFTLGDQPEARWRQAREWLDANGHGSTIDYLAVAARAVHEETGLLPHVNPGVMTPAQAARLRAVSASGGMMLESVSRALCAPGGVHHRSPDKAPARRLATLRAAGEAAMPFTTGLLVGIGDTRADRLRALLAIRRLHERYGHVQEVIVQNFLPKPDTAMRAAPPAALDELRWTLAVARLVLPTDIHLQAPPNLNAAHIHALLDAGIDDFGGVSPVTPDHVNPEAPWPAVETLAEGALARRKVLVPRLPIYPGFAQAPQRWLAPDMRAGVLRAADARGLAREDRWIAGAIEPPPSRAGGAGRHVPRALDGGRAGVVLDRAGDGAALDERDIVALLDARGPMVQAVLDAADALRRETCGDTLSFVVNRNINYTNVCTYKCAFCAFSKGSARTGLRDSAYRLDVQEVVARAEQAAARGATEVCLQGGIHPDYSGATYLEICRAIKAALPTMHVHAFSPLEVSQGAATLGRSVPDFLAELRDAGLGSLPGTAAEILDDEVRALICADKLDTRGWLDVMRAAHGTGLRTTATMMFGHVEAPEHQARHLLRLRELQAETGGFTEFVPLAFVPEMAPMYRRGRSRRGPTWREALLVHAVARIALHPLIPNIQVSWVKLGPDGMRQCLAAGVNDLGGTLMNESITRAAGASHGQEFAPQAMRDLAASAGRPLRQRTTLYADAPAVPPPRVQPTATAEVAAPL